MTPQEIKLLRSRHTRYFGATVACSVDDAPCPEGSGARFDLESIVRSCDLRDLVTAQEVDSICGCVFCGADRDVEGVDIARLRAPKGGNRLLACARLELVDAFGANDFKTAYAVFQTLRVQAVERVPIFVIKCEDHGPWTLESKAEFLGPLGIELASTRVDLGFHGAGLGVVPAVYQAAVGFAAFARDIVCSLDYGDIHIVAGKLPSDAASNDTAADDRDVIALHEASIPNAELCSPWYPM